MKHFLLLAGSRHKCSPARIWLIRLRSSSGRTFGLVTSQLDSANVHGMFTQNSMTENEKNIFDKLIEVNPAFESPTWEICRQWLAEREWKINVLSDYPRGEVKFTVRRGFERIEIVGFSDLEVMGKAISEIIHRHGSEIPKRVEAE